MAHEDRVFRPYRTFLAAGLWGRAILVLLLQLSLIFWPLAVRMARNFSDARGVQNLLNEFSHDYYVPGDYRDAPVKRFRQLNR